MSADTHVLDQLRSGVDRLASYRDRAERRRDADSTTAERLRAVIAVAAVYLLDVRRLLEPTELAASGAERLAERMIETDHAVVEWLAAHRSLAGTVNVISRDPLYRLVCHVDAVLDHLAGEATADGERTRVHLEAMLTRPLALIRAEIAHATSYVSELSAVRDLVEGYSKPG